MNDQGLEKKDTETGDKERGMPSIQQVLEEAMPVMESIGFQYLPDGEGSKHDKGVLFFTRMDRIPFVMKAKIEVCDSGHRNYPVRVRDRILVDFHLVYSQKVNPMSALIAKSIFESVAPDDIDSMLKGSGVSEGGRNSADDLREGYVLSVPGQTGFTIAGYRYQENTVFKDGLTACFERFCPVLFYIDKAMDANGFPKAAKTYAQATENLSSQVEKIVGETENMKVVTGPPRKTDEFGVASYQVGISDNAGAMLFSTAISRSSIKLKMGLNLADTAAKKKSLLAAIKKHMVDLSLPSSLSVEGGDNEDPAVSWVCRLTECDEAARWERLQKALKGLEAIISAIADMSEKQ